MKVYVKKVDGVTLPERGSEVAAGYDIVATSDPKIVGQKCTPVGFESSEIENEWNSIDYIEYETNLYIAPNAVTFHTLLHPRSSVSKYNLVLANSIGLVDNDYRGMIICRFKYVWQPEDFRVVTINAGNQGAGNIYGRVNTNKIYKKGDKIAQLVFEPTVQATFELRDELQATQRGAGGFGSTDASKGKTLMEVFEAEQKPSVAKIAEDTFSILDKYNKLGGVQTPMPYSEQIKKRDEV